MAAGLACLALVAPAAGAGSTASGIVLVVGPAQVFNQGDTACESFGGELRMADGQNLDFSFGGVLTNGQLDAHDQAIVDTIEAGLRDGTTSIATLGYGDSPPLCGLALPNFVTSASLVAAPTPTATPLPAPTPTPTPPGPAPTTHTASGTIAKMSPVGLLLHLAPNYCESWPGVMRTTAGGTIAFAVETPMTGDLATTGLQPADKTASQRAKGLMQARALGRKAPTTITYTTPATACGYNLSAIATAVTVHLPRHSETGLIARLSATRVRSGGCRLWTGVLESRGGQQVRFAVQSRSIADALRRARRRRALTTVTYVIDAGIPCNPRLMLIVVRARSL